MAFGKLRRRKSWNVAKTRAYIWEFLVMCNPLNFVFFFTTSSLWWKVGSDTFTKEEWHHLLQNDAWSALAAGPLHPWCSLCKPAEDRTGMSCLLTSTCHPSAGLVEPSDRITSDSAALKNKTDTGHWAVSQSPPENGFSYKGMSQGRKPTYYGEEENELILVKCWQSTERKKVRRLITCKKFC